MLQYFHQDAVITTTAIAHYWLQLWGPDNQPQSTVYGSPIYHRIPPQRLDEWQFCRTLSSLHSQTARTLVDWFSFSLSWYQRDMWSACSQLSLVCKLYYNYPIIKWYPTQANAVALVHNTNPEKLQNALNFYKNYFLHAVFLPTEYCMWVYKWKQHGLDHRSWWMYSMFLIVQAFLICPSLLWEWNECQSAETHQDTSLSEHNSKASFWNSYDDDELGHLYKVAFTVKY